MIRTGTIFNYCLFQSVETLAFINLLELPGAWNHCSSYGYTRNTTVRYGTVHSRIREHIGSVIGGRVLATQGSSGPCVYVVSQVWGHCILMLRASLGKVVHTVKRAGTFAAKVPSQELHKIAVHVRAVSSPLLSSPSPSPRINYFARTSPSLPSLPNNRFMPRWFYTSGIL
jgi:hypothetical protein